MLTAVLLLLSWSLSIGQEIKTGICYHGWNYFEDHCYGLGHDQVTWPDAQDVCKTFDSGLAEIDTKSENDYLKNLVRTQLGQSAWIGGTDVFSEDYWEWATSKTQITAFTDWAPGEPSKATGAEGEDCLQLFYNQNYTWNNAECKVLAFFVCEGLPLETVIIVG